MDIELKSVQEWFAAKTNKQVSELDDYDLFCAKVAYDFSVHILINNHEKAVTELGKVHI